VLHEPNTIKSRLAPLLLDRVVALRSIKYTQYGEQAATLVQLAVLRAVARLYTAQRSVNAVALASVLESKLGVLRVLWLDALRDAATLDALARVPPPTSAASTSSATTVAAAAQSGAFFVGSAQSDVRPFYGVARAPVLAALARMARCAPSTFVVRQEGAMTADGSTAPHADVTPLTQAALDDYALLLGVTLECLAAALASGGSALRALAQLGCLLNAALLRAELMRDDACADLLRALVTLIRGTASRRVLRATFALATRLAAAHPSVRSTAGRARPSDMLYAFVELFAAPLRAQLEQADDERTMLRREWPAAVRRRAARALGLCARVDAAARAPLVAPVIALLGDALVRETHAGVVRASSASLMALVAAATRDGVDVRGMRSAACGALRHALRHTDAAASALLLRARVDALLALCDGSEDTERAWAAVGDAMSAADSARVPVLLDVALAQLQAAPESAALTQCVCAHVLPAALPALARVSDESTASALIKLALVLHARLGGTPDMADRFAAGVLVRALAATLRADGAGARHELAVQILLRLANAAPAAVKAGVDALDAAAATLLRTSLASALAAIQARQQTAAAVEQERQRKLQDEAKYVADCVTF
jgi:hypothetical protein